MKRLLAAILLLALLAPPLRADSIDEAEAKRRGVPVEAVQLEHANQQIADLRAQVATLQKQLADLKAATTRPATAAASRAASSAPAYSLAKNMTLEEAKQSFPGHWSLASESDGLTHYSIKWMKLTAGPGEAMESEVAQADFASGKLVTYTTFPSRMNGLSRPTTSTSW